MTKNPTAKTCAMRQATFFSLPLNLTFPAFTWCPLVLGPKEWTAFLCWSSPCQSWLYRSPSCPSYHPLPTNTVGSTSSCSVLGQELFQTSHLCLWFAASPKVQKMLHQPRYQLNIFILGRYKCSCFQAFVNGYWGLKLNFCKPSG